MFWDRVAGVYDLVMTLRNGRVNRAFCERVTARLAKTDEVLECACGTGMITVCMAQRCRRVVATDFSGGMLRQTAKKCAGLPNVTVQQADILQLTFADDAFDKVVAGNVIHLLDEPEKALAELLRVCRPGGEVIIPTYVNGERTGRESAFIRVVGRAGANFRKAFTYAAYQDFIRQYAPDAAFELVDGVMPCAIAVIRKA